MVDLVGREYPQATEKQNTIAQLSETYDVSSYVLDNFSLAELKDMGRSIMTDPWFWYSKDKGFSVSVADKVAKRCGIPFDSRRSKAVYLASLENVIDFGHCYARDFQLEKMLTEHSFPIVERNQVEEKLIDSGKIWITKGGKVYPKRLIHCERNFARALVDLHTSAMAYFDNVCVQHPAFDDLADEQKAAVLALQKSNLVILTGLPGTGKTRTVSVISQMYGEENVILCAPTGKAANRITELCGMEARTLHSLLFFTENHEQYQLEGNSTIQNKLVIVDEASMMDIEIAGKLALAIDKTTCKLLIVGDTCQLPSVGPGEVLRQTVESGIGTHCHLTQIRRQNPGSIVNSAHAIASGRDIVKGSDNEVNSYFYGNSPISEIISKVASSPKWDGAQFLTVLREYGSQIANPIIQNIVNPGSGKFRVGDKVIHLKNDRQNNVMNGDTGIVKKILKLGDLIVEFSDNREVFYPKSIQWKLDLSYAFTVHKSQGSEFDTVVFLLNKSRITTRNLLYTGLTRAKRRILILAENEDTIPEAIDNVDKGRQSSLKSYIRHFLKDKECTYK